jgi:hypothetical protein
MSRTVERVRTRIQDPKLTTSISKFTPRRGELFPPASSLLLDAAETKLGFRLPLLLRELYSQVANGGFGPGYGILGLEGGFYDPVITMGEPGGSLLDWYFAYRGDDQQMPELPPELCTDSPLPLFIDPEPKPGVWNWFDKLLPICHHGDWQLSCANCAHPSYPMFLFDGQQSQLSLEAPTFDAWVDSWLGSE